VFIEMISPRGPCRGQNCGSVGGGGERVSEFELIILQYMDIFYISDALEIFKQNHLLITMQPRESRNISVYKVACCWTDLGTDRSICNQVKGVSVVSPDLYPVSSGDFSLELKRV
jgi:hypothetical protein